METYLGFIYLSGLNFAPRGFAFCQGQLMAIAQNSALFSLLGTNFGGDGRTTFGLPDFRSRVPMGAGNGPGLTPRILGQRSGQEQTTLGVQNLPSHNHTASGKIAANGAAGTESSPVSNYPALGQVTISRGNTVDADNFSQTAGAFMADNGVEVTVGNTGQSQPFSNVPPFETVNFVIALQGIFPPRN